ncbi:hypothetical protein G6F62_014570 [Rhizopus arrhizus]|nr:hypothetical protein G6F62_014570 [Rhizopus arrhizus]
MPSDANTSVPRPLRSSRQGRRSCGVSRASRSTGHDGRQGHRNHRLLAEERGGRRAQRTEKGLRDGQGHPGRLGERDQGGHQRQWRDHRMAGQPAGDVPGGVGGLSARPGPGAARPAPPHGRPGRAGPAAPDG